MADFSSFYPPIDPPFEGTSGKNHQDAAFLTFDVVQERLVEAMITCWKDGDRERAWQRVRSTWPEVMRETSAGDYDARGGDGSSSDVAMRPAALTRLDVAEMEEAFGWTSVLSGEDRRLVAIVIAQLARGRREVSWPRVLRSLGEKRGTDGLRMRYGRAITAMCVAGSRGNPREVVSSG